MTTTEPVESDVRMDPDIRDAWASVMRDVRVNLGRQFLCRRFQRVSLFDPLGMLCVLGVDAGVIEDGHWIGDDQTLMYKVYAGEQGILPREIVKWAGLRSQNPSLMLSAGQRNRFQLPERYSAHGNWKPRPVPLAAISDYGHATREQLALLIETL